MNIGDDLAGRIADGEVIVLDGGMERSSTLAASQWRCVQNARQVGVRDHRHKRLLCSR
jgi:hypothetical protein